MRRQFLAFIPTAIILAMLFAPLAMLLLLPLQEGAASLLPGLDGRRLLLLGRSLLVAGAAAGGAAAIGIPLAFSMARRPAWLLACLLPFFVPPYLQAMLWPRLLGLAGLPASAFSPLATGIAIFAISHAPIVMLLTASGLRQFPGQQLEAGLLARPPAAVLCRIRLPGIAPNIAAGFSLAFVFTLTNFEVPDLLGFKVYPVEIFIAVSAYYDEAGAALLAMPLVAVTLALVVFQAKGMAGRTYLLPPLRDTRPHGQYSLPWPAISYLFVAAGLPLLTALAGNQASPRWGQAWTVARPALLFSLATALAGGLLTTIAALPPAIHASNNRQGRTNRFVHTACQLPLAIPSLLIGLGTTRLAGHTAFAWLYDSTACYLLAVTIAHLPFAVTIIASRLASIPKTAIDAARLARNPAAVFARIVLPPLWPALATAALTVFTLALANLSLPLLTLPPGRETLPLKLYNYLHYGAREMVYRMGAMLVLAAASATAVMALPWWAGRRTGRRRTAGR